MGATTHVLFITTHRLNYPHKNWNLELLSALKAHSIPTTTHALVDDRDMLPPESIARNYTHVCFLLLGDYPTHHHTFSKFLNETLEDALILNPSIRVLNSPSITAWNSDKQYIDELFKAGFSVPTTAFLNKRQPLEYLKMGLYTQCHGNPVVIKPSISASGARTHRVTNPQQLTPEDDAFLAGIVNLAVKSGTRSSQDGSSRSRSLGHDGDAQQDGVAEPEEEEPEDGTFGSFMMQEYIPEVEQGEYSLCYVGGQYLFTVLKRPKAGGWQVGSSFGGSSTAVPEDEVPREGRRMGQQLIEWIEDHFDGEKVDYARVDGVVRSDGTFTLMEIELIEPSLFMGVEGIGKRAVDAICELFTLTSAASENLRPVASAP